LTLLYDKHELHDNKMRTIQHQRAVRTQTGPSIARRASFDDARNIEAVLEGEVPIPRHDEPNLYNLPHDLYPTYRALPVSGRIGLTIICIWLAAATTFENKVTVWLRPLISAAKQGINPRSIASFVAKSVVMYLIGNLVLQDIFTSPSRISTRDLISRYFLPSSLSSYERVSLSDGQDIGVHTLRYALADQRNSRYSALYLNHGFGASSLSWLPVIPKLAERLRVKKTVAHDAVGFGFTDRPKNVSFYTPISSSQIGIQLLDKARQHQDEKQAPVLLMGHSMGSFATLEMASKLPEDVPVTVILVAPALGISRREKYDKGRPRPIVDFLQSYVVGPPLSYLLRRLVGTNGFWKAGLQSVWGNPKLVTDSDALRFQWPAIGHGWEQGLLRFTRAMSRFADGDLVQRVARRPNTRIVVILGQADKVISRKTVEKVFAGHPEVPIVEVDGCGHDPYEEKVDDFVDMVDSLLSVA
jgi:pimeloyl-ACP methyl ester carboxylesterase